MRSSIFIVSAFVLLTACKQGSRRADAGEQDTSLKKGVVLVDYREKQKVDVYIDGDIFASYIYPPGIGKPVLHPVRSASGTIVTRGYPPDPREGGLTDYPQHIGMWFGYGDVNGFDFWNNYTGLYEARPGTGGRILHRGVKRAESRDALGVLEVTADWQVPAGGTDWHTVLQETTVFEFSGDGNTRTIDRTTWLTAQEDDVVFGNNEKGLFAVVFADAIGKPAGNDVVDNEGMDGHFFNSEGMEDEEVWGRPAGWLGLSAVTGEEQITVAIFDHPENPGYPGYWPAGENGLLAINNMGHQDLRLMAGESAVFRHRIHITSGYFASSGDLDGQFAEFSR